ncbi:MAG TPA: hypothetical protein VEU29_05590 [Actinomycetota bacterium]|nr:hypothetical protein [Actinomycetota bacterium]
MGSQRVFVFLVAVIVAGLVAIAILAGRSGDSCEKWQAAYEEADVDGATGTLQFINQGLTAELMARRPDGCAVP